MFSLFFRVLRVYNTQTKRVAFNVTKMPSGGGSEGEVNNLTFFPFKSLLSQILAGGIIRNLPVNR